MRIQKLAVLSLMLTLGISVVGCSESSNTRQGNTARATQLHNTSPGEFFPSEVGTRWVYTIILGEAEPLRYHETVWPVDRRSGSLVVNRGRFIGTFSKEQRDRFTLEIEVEKRVLKQGPLEYSDGVRINVVRDELGVYHDAGEVFWAINKQGDFMPHQVTMYPPGSPGAPRGSWGSWSTKPGYSVRILFFARKPGISIGIGKEPSDRLMFQGFLPTDEPIMRFVRTVAASNDERGSRSTLDREFQEEMLFARHRGLVYLEQTVNGVISMTWRLAEFSPSPGLL